MNANDNIINNTHIRINNKTRTINNIKQLLITIK